MRKVDINLKNCYGIKSLEYVFDFGIGDKHRKSFAIYAPNGLMKTSLTKTFENIASSQSPREERFNKVSSAEIIIDEQPITAQSIYVLKSEIDISEESPEISNMLVNPDKKARYDALVLGIEKQKGKAVSALQKLSGVPKKEIIKTISSDVGHDEFLQCLILLNDDIDHPPTSNPYDYATIFDSSVAQLLKEPGFLSNAREFTERYQEIFDQEGTIFKKDVFSPIKADRSFSTLKAQGYFESGHRLFLKGDTTSLGIDEVEERVKNLLAKIENDKSLKTIKDQITKNAQTQAIGKLFETLPMVEIENLLEGLKPSNQKAFKRGLWVSYVKSSPEVDGYINLYLQAKNEIESIESEAASIAPDWLAAVELFNDRFTDMPFKLVVENQAEASLGKAQAKLSYLFEDGDSKATKLRGDLKSLSQGEKRALYLLNFIFEIEAKSKLPFETILIIDDIADSFDYKNKHAIIQYLEDVEKKQNLYQIILTHNYDFFRSVAVKFVNRQRCLMANKHPDRIELKLAQGVENYFNGILKRDFSTSLRAMCATIPFTRNIIEYTRGVEHADYLKLTSLLHQKQDTDSITHQHYVDIYNSTFGLSHLGSERTITEILTEQAEEIATDPTETGLNLEDKVLMSMAIRLKAEIFMLNKIRVASNNANYWCDEKNQFGKILKIYTETFKSCSSHQVLRKVSVTVSSNIHLNSFMYEPILDLSITHLSHLYREIKALEQAGM